MRLWPAIHMEAAERERLSLEPLTSLTQLLGLAIIHLHENKHRCRYTDKHIYAYFIHLPTYIHSLTKSVFHTYIHKSFLLMRNTLTSARQRPPPPHSRSPAAFPPASRSRATPRAGARPWPARESSHSTRGRDSRPAITHDKTPV